MSHAQSTTNTWWKDYRYSNPKARLKDKSSLVGLNRDISPTGKPIQKGGTHKSLVEESGKQSDSIN